MTIVAGFDVHRRQITFDALDTETGELTRGRIDATPAAVERWVARFEGREVQVALEACTGWLFVSRALERAGAVAASRRAGRDERAARAQATREDRSRGRALAAHAAGRGTAAGILDPAGTRPRVALARAAAQDARRRAHAMAAAHPGDAVSPRHRWRARRAALRPPDASSCEELELPADARERIAIALAMVDSLDGQLRPLESELRKLARRQTGCRALMAQFGMGELTALMTLTELGDVQRLSASRKAVRMAGIDIGVHRSDRRSRVGKLNRQGSPHLRWALYEAALSATRPTSPDHEDYLALKARGLSHTRASLTIARKLARRSFHILRELGPAALEPITTT